MNILVLNAGSSSLKMCLYAMESPRPLDEEESVLAVGEIERIAAEGTHLQITVGQGTQQRKMDRQVTASNISEAAEQMLELLLSPETHSKSPSESPSESHSGSDSEKGLQESGKTFRVDAVGHRIVHGGPRFVDAVRIDADVHAELKRLVGLAPLHMPGCVAGVEAGMRLLPNVPSVAVFDTAFHHDLPPVTSLYALPRALSEAHQLRRYGFHGISYRYVTERALMALRRNAPGSRLVLCHLGGGASVCAVRDGKSVDTSMGFTPLEGLIMGTRSGDIDAGLVIHLMRSLHMGVDEVEQLLNKRSGLLGLSGVSNDVRDLEKAREAGDAPAREALEAFAYRVRKYIGAYAAAMGGIDALIFTDKIGAHAVPTRSRICEGLAFLGLGLDPTRNVDHSGPTPIPIGTDSGGQGTSRVWIVPTDEERQIARETYGVLNA